MKREKKGLLIDSDAISYLISAVGTQLGDLVSAIEKVSLFLDASNKKGAPLAHANLHDVSQIVAETQIYNVFKLTDALGKKDIENSSHILHSMIRAGEHPLKILTMIARHFRILLKLHDPSIRSLPQKEKAGSVGVSPYYLRDYERDASRFPLNQCRSIHRLILSTDQQLKSSSVSDSIIMEHLLFSICLGSD